MTTEQENIYKADREEFELLRKARSGELIKENPIEIGGDRYGITDKMKYMVYLIQMKVMDLIFR
ncbi:hypothetical protein [Psychrilyobacter sp.]|uniref:hypothetical protein n=1 Tax=Psychrilyobacter sp. TaxID=2586924 RepID=UPI0030173CFB